ncbi:MAG TPA: AbrB/MazE/SpoVT family DNA-binding domain-containing protein [Myxococcales bacterium]|jgi:antitoxin component of MazEF toxin-antitoxin module|nr:AbrB/MazE/SpoVT family DNA-binding domain-containing protein [Myxococcales bacterium]
MRKKLSAIGNSLGIVIEKPILELLKIDRDTELEITTDGRSLTLKPVDPVDDKKRFDEAAKRALKTHANTFRKLAK